MTSAPPPAPTGAGKAPCTVSWRSSRASAPASAASLAATTSTPSSGRRWATRTSARPIRPRPLIPIRTLTVRNSTRSEGTPLAPPDGDGPPERELVTLRLRLFLLLAGLVALLVAGQTLLVRSLAERLDRDVAVVAARVGEEILSGFEFHADGGESGPNRVADGRARVLVVTRRASVDGGPPGEGAGAEEPKGD